MTSIETIPEQESGGRMFHQFEEVTIVRGSGEPQDGWRIISVPSNENEKFFLVRDKETFRASLESLRKWNP